MPEFILPAEADHCFHCGKVLTFPPSCCEEAQKEWEEFQERDWGNYIDPAHGR